MILADKIIEERKRIGLSQEELAEKLDVSRQAVSKWEGAQSIPDINRILQMAEIFGVSTDYLLKEDADRDGGEIIVRDSAEPARDLRRVSMEEASSFIELRKNVAPTIAFGVSLCISSPILLIILAGCSEAHLFGINAAMGVALGVIVLLLMIASAVMIFVKNGRLLDKYSDFEKKEIETEYGVDGMVKERKASYESTYSRCVSIGVCMCILCSVPLLIACFLCAPDYVITSMVGVLLLIVAVAVNLFVRVGTVMGTYDILLQLGDYTPNKKEKAPIIDKFSGVYWMSCVAVYLAISFIGGRWDRTWILWPVAGVLFAVVRGILGIIVKED